METAPTHSLQGNHLANHSVYLITSLRFVFLFVYYPCGIVFIWLPKELVREGRGMPCLTYHAVAGTFGAQFTAFCTYTYGSIHTVSITGVCN